MQTSAHLRARRTGDGDACGGGGGGAPLDPRPRLRSLSDYDEPLRGGTRALAACAWACGGCAAVTVLYVACLVIFYVVLGVTWVAPTVATSRAAVPIRGLHPSLWGLRIAFVSDIHFNAGRTNATGATRAMLADASRIVEREDVALTVLGGDLVDHWPTAAEDLAVDWLPRLRSQAGTFAVLGNHDYQLESSRGLVAAAFLRAGVRLLVNEAALPLAPPARPWLELVGLGDVWGGEYAPERVLRPASAGAGSGGVSPDAAAPGPAAAPLPSNGSAAAYRTARIVVSHNPDSAHDLAQWDVDLVLSGHTHGGVTCFPHGVRQLAPWVRHLLPAWAVAHIPGARDVHTWDTHAGLNYVPRRRLRARPRGAPPVTPEELAVVAARPFRRGGPAVPVFTSTGLTRGDPARWLCEAEVAIITLWPAADGAAGAAGRDDEGSGGRRPGVGGGGGGGAWWGPRGGARGRPQPLRRR